MIFDNGKSYDHSGHSVDFFTEKANQFISEQSDNQQPFFLFLPLPAPYGHWPATKEAESNRHTDRYANCPMETIPRVGLSKAAVDGFMMNQVNSSAELDLSMLMRAPNDLATLRNYYSQISMIDDGVGSIMQTLDDLGLDDNTLVIFTSDHGLSLGHHGFWGHGGATFPSNLHRAAHSVPLLIKHKKSINASENSNPSRSLTGLYEGNLPDKWGDDIVYSEQEETRILRTPEWVLFKRFNGSENRSMCDELYNVQADPNETNNLSGDPAFADIETRLSDKLDAFFSEHAIKKCDLWNGGVPLQNSVRRAFWKEVWGDSWNPVYAYEDD